MRRKSKMGDRINARLGIEATQSLEYLSKELNSTKTDVIETLLVRAAKNLKDKRSKSS